MRENTKRILLTSLILFIVNSLLFVTVLVIKAEYDIQGYIDGFFMSGFITLLLSSLRFLGARGSFDLWGYTAINFFAKFRPSVEPRYKDGYEYKEYKKAERAKKKVSFIPYFVVPLIFILVSVILLIITKVQL